jgi:MoxR-like ATPase
MSTITTDIQQRITSIIADQNSVIKERGDLVHGTWVAFIGQLHLLILGKGGTGKSMTVRDAMQHIDDSQYFETALDETSTPDQVFGPPDIKGMVEKGVTRRVVTGMFPEATHAFIDEFFNGNGPVLKALQPALNERVFHNNGHATDIPLRSCLMGTNLINADVTLAPLFDRVHLRFPVTYVKGRQNQSDMVTEAIARMALTGRGTSTRVTGERTKVTLAELDQAHAEALALEVPDSVLETYFDIREGLLDTGIEISDRRAVEGMVAVLSNAWLRGHEEVQVGDLDILGNMWWTVQDQVVEAQKLILGVTNPGEKAGMDLLDELDKLQAELNASSNGVDEAHKSRLGIQAVKDTDKLIAKAKEHRSKAEKAGTSTTRLDETIQRADSFKFQIGKEIFGLDPADLAAMS